MSMPSVCPNCSEFPNPNISKHCEFCEEEYHEGCFGEHSEICKGCMEEFGEGTTEVIQERMDKAFEEKAKTKQRIFKEFLEMNGLDKNGVKDC